MKTALIIITILLILFILLFVNVRGIFFPKKNYPPEPPKNLDTISGYVAITKHVGTDAYQVIPIGKQFGEVSSMHYEPTSNTVVAYTKEDKDASDKILVFNTQGAFIDEVENSGFQLKSS